MGPNPFGVGLGAWGAKFGGSGATLPHIELPTENFAPFTEIHSRVNWESKI